MLVLTRHPGESIIIGGEIEVRVVDVQGSKVCLGIIAPREVVVDRMEVHYDRKRKWNSEANTSRNY